MEVAVVVALVTLLGTTVVGPLVAWLLARRQQRAAVTASDVDSLGQIIDRLQRENERLAGAVEEMRATSATREAEHRTRVHELQQLIADQAHEIRLLRDQVARMRRGLTDTPGPHDLHPEGT